MTQNLWADLHVHTNYSDGLLSPADMVQRAKESGLCAMGIVDHDTVDGIHEAELAGERFGIEVVPGVELSSQIQGREIHIIGYYFNTQCPKLVDFLELFCQERHKRAGKMIQNLNRIGVNLSMTDVEEKAKGTSIGRPHIAEALMEKGYVETVQEAFQKYIGYNSKSYEGKYRILPEEAIQLIYECRGLSFLAHPSPFIHDAIILDLIKAGLDGIEVVHPYIYDYRRKSLENLARQNGLVVSGGSDCHGGRDGLVLMGKWKIPYRFLEDIKLAHERKWKN
jgi:predicted metal-dependent phosphoesterase TrpH